MIDINKMRLLVQDYKLAGSPVFVQAADMNEILDRLETAEKDINLKERIIDAIGSTLNAVANERDDLLARIEAAEELVRELQRNLSSGMWRVLREENEVLSARIETMEKQKPVYLFRRKGWEEFCTCSKERYEEFYTNPRVFEVKKLYALPGAKGEGE